MDGSLYLIIFMALTSAWSGGSLWPSRLLPKWATFIPEAAFALGFAYANSFWSLPTAYLCLIAGVSGMWSYAWMQSGPGPALQWGTDPGGMGKARTLTPLVDWLSGRFGFKRGDVNYCRLYLAVKGFLIGLPVGGIPLAIGWPLAYETGFRMGNRHVIKEALAGAFAGLSIIIFLKAVPLIIAIL